MHKFVELLHREVVPAQGCTEPIAVAYAVSIAAEQQESPAEHIELYLSGNIVKNALGVGIPGTGRIGIDIAALLGAVLRRSDKKLEILTGLTPEQLKQAEELLDQKILQVNLKEDTTEKLYIEAVVHAGGHTARCVVQKSHTNVVLIEKDGAVTFEKKEAASQEEEGHVELTVREIYEFATTAPFEEISFILEGARMNKAVSEEGLRGDYGANVGRVLLTTYGDDVKVRARAAAAAGSDARMNGCELPVVINSGSGNQGLTASLPVIEYAKEMKADREKLYRALVISNLTAVHLKEGIGRLSAYCGAVTAGAGAGAGIAWLLGGGLDEINHTIVNTLANVSGIICDGAKASCAAKIATSVEAGILGYYMYKNGQEFYGGDGIVKKGVERTIENVARLGRDGMRETDREILEIMIGDAGQTGE